MPRVRYGRHANLGLAPHHGCRRIRHPHGVPAHQRPSMALSFASVSGLRRSSTVILVWVRSASSRATSRSVASISCTSIRLEILVTDAAYGPRLVVDRMVLSLVTSAISRPDR